MTEPDPIKTVQDSRFWAKVDRKTDSECWLWKAHLSGSGYGSIRRDKVEWLAHRLSWVLANGPIPPGLFVCHHCDNKLCVNPSHLFLGTMT